MLKLIKSELSYQRTSIIIAMVIFSLLCILMFNVSIDGQYGDIPGMMGILTAIIGVVWFMRFIRYTKEKTVVYHATLPIKMSTVAIIKTCVIPVLVISGSAVGLIVYATSQITSSSIQAVWYIASSAGALFCFNAVFHLHHDLGELIAEARIRGIVTSVFALLMVTTLLVVNAKNINRYADTDAVQPLNTAEQMLQSIAWQPVVAITVFLSGLLVTAGAILVFLKRRSYLK